MAHGGAAAYTFFALRPLAFVATGVTRAGVMFAVSDALSAVASAASPLTKSAHRISKPLRLPLSANTNLSGVIVTVYGV